MKFRSKPSKSHLFRRFFQNFVKISSILLTSKFWFRFQQQSPSPFLVCRGLSWTVWVSPRAPRATTRSSTFPASKKKVGMARTVPCSRSGSHKNLLAKNFIPRNPAKPPKARWSVRARRSSTMCLPHLQRQLWLTRAKSRKRHHSLKWLGRCFLLRSKLKKRKRHMRLSRAAVYFLLPFKESKLVTDNFYFWNMVASNDLYNFAFSFNIQNN